MKKKAEFCAVIDNPTLKPNPDKQFVTDQIWEQPCGEIYRKSKNSTAISSSKEGKAKDVFSRIEHV